METETLKQVGEELEYKVNNQFGWLEPVELIDYFNSDRIHTVKGSIEEKYEFVTTLFFNRVINEAFKTGLRNRSLVMYDLVDEICTFLNSLGISKNDMVRIVNMIIRADHNLNDNLYRNVNAIKDRMIDPSKLVFGKQLELFCNPYEYRPIFYNGVKYNCFNVKRRKNYITPHNCIINGTTHYLRRDLYKDYVNSKLRPYTHIIMKDGSHTNIRLSNIVLKR